MKIIFSQKAWLFQGNEDPKEILKTVKNFVTGPKKMIMNSVLQTDMPLSLCTQAMTWKRHCLSVFQILKPLCVLKASFKRESATLPILHGMQTAGLTETVSALRWYSTAGHFVLSACGAGVRRIGIRLTKFVIYIHP